MNSEYWHPKDKSWMSARKELWRTVKYNLDLLSHKNWPIRRRDHKYHKELFFYGTISERVGDELEFDWDPTVIPYHEISGLTAFGDALPIFRLWYHPEPEAIDLDQLRNDFRLAGSLDHARDRFFNDFVGAGGGGYGHSYYPEYGMMGGREPLVVKFLCPGLDYQQEMPGVRDPSLTSRPCFRPKDTFQVCLSSTRRELSQDANFFPYDPGQYLWDHLAYAVEHYPDALFDPEKNSAWSNKSTPRNDLLIVIAEILGLEQRTDASRRRPSTSAMVERLIGQYERRDFPETMLKIWDEAKADIKRLREESAKLQMFKLDEERLRRRSLKDYPPEKQREWIARWKQV